MWPIPGAPHLGTRTNICPCNPTHVLARSGPFQTSACRSDYLYLPHIPQQAPEKDPLLRSWELAPNSLIRNTACRAPSLEWCLIVPGPGSDQGHDGTICQLRVRQRDHRHDAKRPAKRQCQSFQGYFCMASRIVNIIVTYS